MTLKKLNSNLLILQKSNSNSSVIRERIQIQSNPSKNFDAIVETDEFKSLDKDGVRSYIEILNRNHVTETSFSLDWSVGVKLI